MALAAALPYAITGLSALAGLFGNRAQKQTSTEDYWKELYDWISKVTQGTTSRQAETLGGETPTYDPYQAEMRDQILRMLSDRATGATDLSGYTGQGLRTINDAAALKQKALNSILASRGLSYSPVAASAMGNLESSRVGEAVNFMNQLPLLQRQLQGEDLDRLSKFWAALPYGKATKSNVNEFGQTWEASDTTHRGTEGGQTTRVGNTSGNRLGGFLTGLGSGLASTWGQKYGYNLPIPGKKP